MKSCHNCKNQHICAFFRDYEAVTTKGLQMRVLTTSEAPTEETTSSWMDIYRAIARSCSHYTVWDSRLQLTKNTKKYAQDLARNLQKDKSFVQEFLVAPSNEARVKLLDRRMDDNYDQIIEFLAHSQKDQETAEDLYESFQHEVMQYFGV
jgi:hypothetical protein